MIQFGKLEMIDWIIYYTILYLSYDDGWIRSFLKKGSIGKDLYLIFLIYSFRITIFSEMNSLLSMQIDYLTAKIKKRK